MEPSGSQAVRRLQEELIAAQRNALLGSIAGMMAHEFNNLMTPVLARAQDAVQRDDVAAMRKALNVTVTQTQKAIDVTRRLLELATGAAPLAARPVRLRAALDDAIAASVRPPAKDGIELSIDVADDASVLAEPVLLIQVLLNLLLYARAGITERSGRIAVRALPEDGVVRIEIDGSGTAVSHERIETVVAPFLAQDVREQPCDAHDVGLALNVCRTIVQFHHGTISARAGDAGGCAVTIRWPATPAR